MTEMWLAENHWKICLPHSIFKEDLHLSERLINVLGGEEREEQAVNQSQVLH